MITLLRENPLLLLFLVAGIGYPLGRIRIGEASIGVAAVLFVGLAFGALDPSLKMPEIVHQLGLALFVYNVGLSSGPGFFASLRGRGLRDNLFILSMILGAAGLTVGLHFLLALRPAMTAGLFAGSLTSTPSLAAAVDYLKGRGVEVGLSEPVVGYSLGYPVSILSMILTIYIVQRLWKVDYAAEARQVGAGVNDPITNITVRVTKPELAGLTIREVVEQHQLKAVFGRLKHDQHYEVVGWKTRLHVGDLLTVVGSDPELERVALALGEVAEEHADMDRGEVDTRRMFVSNPKVAGMRIKDLALPQKHGAVITRVRRGDVDLLPHADMVLELGDRVRVLARRNVLSEVAGYFGDSVKALSEINITSWAFGLALGILLGTVPIPIPGGITLKLGMAGGPLVVALLLGNIHRTGTFVWTLPYSANMTLRQIGLIFFLAGVGTRSGYEFYTTLVTGTGLPMLGAAAVIVCTTAFLTLWIGHRLLKIPMGLLVGMLAGLQTQAATLGFTLEQTKNELPNVGYATIYPLAMVSKIVLAQVLLALLL